jgi:TRAP-type C4-dicarboxylate transport system permease small subunit
VRRVFAVWHRLERNLAVAAYTAMALVLVLDVLGREFLAPLLRAAGFAAGAGGVFGASKIAVYCIIFGTYAGIGVAAATASHIVPRAGYFVVPRAWGAMVDRCGDAVTAALLLMAAFAGYLLVRGSWETGLRAPILQWPMWAVQLAMPLGFISAALRYAGFACWPALRPPPRAVPE